MSLTLFLQLITKSKTKEKYKQKYRKAWEKEPLFKGWLQPVEKKKLIKHVAMFAKENWQQL